MRYDEFEVKEIAGQLGLSHQTVSAYLKDLQKKLDVRGRGSLKLWARTHLELLDIDWSPNGGNGNSQGREPDPPPLLTASSDVVPDELSIRERRVIDGYENDGERAD